VTVASKEQLAILNQGVDVWNEWREDNPEEEIDLSGANLSDADLCGVNLSETYLGEADPNRNSPGRSPNAVYIMEADDKCVLRMRSDLSEANLEEANLSEANLSFANLRKAELCGVNLNGADLTSAVLNGAGLFGADLNEAILNKADLSNSNLERAKLLGAKLSKAKIWEANLREAKLDGADLSEAVLNSADLYMASLIGADLTEACLMHVSMVETNLTGSILTDCKIYGISAWGVNLEGAEQSNLVITPPDQPVITVDDLEVAQFVYLLLNNEKIRDVLDTIGKKGVLILGRFTPERKQVLDALRDKLRKLNFMPMVFDFEGAQTKDFTETVKILAGMSRFIIADITSPKSSPLELQATVPDYKVPFVPIIHEGEQPFSMFKNLQSYSWMLDLLEYKDSDQLIAVIDKAIIQPALIKADELNFQKAAKVRKRHASDYQ
jgi:uncharacterized protein YjbI with pentapeptide repeats